MSDDSFHWLDDELRRVPLPEGLLERLRQAGPPSAEDLTDDILDQALVSVPVPANLLASLEAIVEDELLDAQLRDVEVPTQLLEEIAHIPQDEQLRDVPVPVDMLLELRRIPPRRRRRIPNAQLAIAASLLLMITAGYVLSMTGLVMSAYNQLPQPYALFSVDSAPVELTADVAGEEAVAIEIAQPPAATPATTQTLVYDPTYSPVDSRPIVDVIRADLPAGYSLDDDVLLIAGGLLGGQTYVADDRLPDLELLSGFEPRGIPAPLEKAFDRHFLVTKRTNPIVPLAEPSSPLTKVELPVWTQAGSFDRLRNCERLPSAREIHVEDFLAAMDFQYAPAPDEKLAIRVTAGLSMFGEALRGNRPYLMQVGVQAGLPATYRAESVHLTLALDVSDSMQWENRLDSVRGALLRFVKLMRRDDRLSLVVFNEDAFTLLEDVSGEDVTLVATALDNLRPLGGTNALAGLQEAASLADHDAALDCQERHLIVISDGMPRLSASTADGLKMLLGSLKRLGTDLHVVAINSSVDTRDGMIELSALADKPLATCATTEALHEHLCDQVLGVSPTVARDATVTVSFNADAVEAYRLLGHENTNAGGTVAAASATMLAGEAGTGLYEVWLRPTGPSLIATSEVTWKDRHGKSHTTHQEIHRTQFKTSWRESALPLQAAAIAAQAAEVLRESPFAQSRNRDLRAVLEHSREVNPRLAERESFQRFIQVLEHAERVRRGIDEKEDRK